MAESPTSFGLPRKCNKIILYVGADPDIPIPDEEGQTLSYVATIDGSPNVVKMLFFKTDANFNSRNKDGTTALDCTMDDKTRRYEVSLEVYTIDDIKQ